MPWLGKNTIPGPEAPTTENDDTASDAEQKPVQCRVHPKYYRDDLDMDLVRCAHHIDLAEMQVGEDCGIPTKLFAAYAKGRKNCICRGQQRQKKGSGAKGYTSKPRQMRKPSEMQW